MGSRLSEESEIVQVMEAKSRMVVARSSERDRWGDDSPISALQDESVLEMFAAVPTVNDTVLCT